MRVFIAIEFTKDIKNYIESIQSQVRQSSKYGNFTRKKNFHLTLKFIGSINDSDLEDIKKCIDKSLDDNFKFKLKMGDIGQFPRKDKKLIWMGLEDKQALKDIYKTLEDNLEDIGIKKENREFKPHITIGREVVLEKTFDELKKTINLGDLEICVDKLTLMESCLKNNKITYTPIYKRSLQ